MQRREFITLFGGTAATWPLAVRAQQPAGRVYRVGYLGIAAREQQLYLIKAFEEGLRSLGYRVGENVVIEYRFADDEMERLPALAADLVRPGGNVTGFSLDAGNEIHGKRLELLKETLPNLSRVGILWNPDFAPNQSRLTSMRKVTQTLGLTLIPAEARGLDA